MYVKLRLCECLTTNKVTSSLKSTCKILDLCRITSTQLHEHAQYRSNAFSKPMQDKTKTDSWQFKRNQMAKVSAIICTHFPLNWSCMSSSNSVTWTCFKTRKPKVPYCWLKGCFSRPMLIHPLYRGTCTHLRKYFWAGKTFCRHTGSLSRPREILGTRIFSLHGWPFP